MANGRGGKDNRPGIRGGARAAAAGQDAPDDGLGPDEIRARNERRGIPGETTRTQGVVESFELMDPKKRAEHMKRR